MAPIVANSEPLSQSADAGVVELSAEGIKQQQAKRRLSLRFRKYRKMHAAAKEVLPSTRLASHRYWVAVEKPTKVGGLSDPTKRYQWFKGNRLTCVETLRRMCGQRFYDDDVQLLLGDLAVDDHVQAQEMDFFSDKIVVLKAVSGKFEAAKITAGLTSTIFAKESGNHRNTPPSSAESQDALDAILTTNDEHDPIILDDEPTVIQQADPVPELAKSPPTGPIAAAMEDMMVIEDD